MLFTMALAKIPAYQSTPSPDPGAKGLIIGIIVLTVIAGLLAAIQQLRRSDAWPVPLVIYYTLLPVTLFVLIAAQLLGEGIGYGYVATVVAPLPLILLLRRPWSASPSPTD